MNTNYKIFEYPFNLLADIYRVDTEAEIKLLEKVFPYQNILKERIELILKQVNERTLKIMSLRYKDKLSLREIGSIIDVSQERVRQILSKVLGKFRYKSTWCVSNSESVYNVLRTIHNEDLTSLSLSGFTDEELETELSRRQNSTDSFSGVLNVPLNSLGLTTRTFHCIIRHLERYKCPNVKCGRDYFTISHLITLSEEEITRIRNLGQKSYDEIIEVMKNFGYTMVWDNYKECSYFRYTG